jgi:hypothetical protein
MSKSSRSRGASVGPELLTEDLDETRPIGLIDLVVRVHRIRQLVPARTVSNLRLWRVDHDCTPVSFAARPPLRVYHPWSAKRGDRASDYRDERALDPSYIDCMTCDLVPEPLSNDLPGRDFSGAKKAEPRTAGR